MGRRLVCDAPVLATTVLLLGCRYQQTIRHPTLPQLVPIERTMSCPQIDLAIDRADTVRWVIREDGGELETSKKRAARYTANFVIVPLTILGGAPAAMGDGGHAVLNAADGRLRELLQLKRDRGCAPRSTALAEVDDLELLDALDSVEAQLQEGGDQSRLYVERTRLLDALRPVAAPDRQH